MAKKGYGDGGGLSGDTITKMGGVTDKPSNAKTQYDCPAFSKPRDVGGDAVPEKIMDTMPAAKAGTSPIKTTMQPLKGSGNDGKY